jgi:CRISPR-associated protein Cmr4
MTEKPFGKQTYFAMALDPIHVGTGGYRLGRVDMSIVREPGTNVPKIPGTSLSGACRTYAAMAKDRYRWEDEDTGKTYVCAGQGQPDKDKGTAGHCGRPDCPICVTFGFSRGNHSFQGLAQFSDARLVLFPVHSLAGPVWVTCPSILNDRGITAQAPADTEVRVTSGVQVKDRLNLGWLMLTVADNDNDFELDADVLSAVPEEIRNRAVLVSDKLFGQIVNDNLEVRTSVSIDPATGAAADGALFTYEALPRSSVLLFDVVMSDPKYYQIGGQTPSAPVRETVKSGLQLFKSLGVGGMNTRGMGRLWVLNLDAGGE